MARPKSNLPVFSFHIKGWKTERDGTPMNVPGADSTFAHFGEGTISETIAKVLCAASLGPEHIISITADMTGKGDTGSWDFWMFCRNPGSATEEA